MIFYKHPHTRKTIMNHFLLIIIEHIIWIQIRRSLEVAQLIKRISLYSFLCKDSFNILVKLNVVYKFLDSCSFFLELSL